MTHGCCGWTLTYHPSFLSDRTLFDVLPYLLTTSGSPKFKYLYLFFRAGSMRCGKKLGNSPSSVPSQIAGSAYTLQALL